ncbi:hypothetical protein BH10BAC6_BH10BAC6_02300 [soil metagenome]
MILNTEAIVLHSRKYGDTSRIAVIYTRSHGKMHVHAKGARMPKSPFGSSLDPLRQCAITVYHKKMRELQMISQAEVTIRRRILHESFDHLTLGLSLCETVIRTQRDEEPNEELFSLLVASLNALESASQPVAIGMVFRIHLATLMGFGLPDSGPYEAGNSLYLSVENGMMTVAGPRGYQISALAYALLRTLMELSPEDAGSLTVTDANRVEIDAFLSAYYSHHLERRIVTTSFDMLRTTP